MQDNGIILVPRPRSQLLINKESDAINALMQTPDYTRTFLGPLGL